MLLFFVKQFAIHKVKISPYAVCKLKMKQYASGEVGVTLLYNLKLFRPLVTPHPTPPSRLDLKLRAV